MLPSLVSFSVQVSGTAPNWTDKLSAISTAVAALGFVGTAVGVWFAWDLLKETRRDRHIQVLSDFGRRWDEPEIAEARRKQRKYDSDTLAEEVDKWFHSTAEGSDVPILLRVPNYFEDLAIMVECGRLELAFVARAMRTNTLREWAYWEKAITKIRADSAESYVEFEKLAGQLRTN